MKNANWLVVEALFLPKLRRRLPQLLESLDRGVIPHRLLRDHVVEVEKLHRSKIAVDWPEFGQFLLAERTHLRQRARSLSKGMNATQRLQVLREDDDASETETLDHEVQAAVEDLSKSIAVSEARRMNGEGANQARRNEARQRLADAASSLLSRGEPVSIASIAREGKLSRNTVKQNIDVLDSLIRREDAE